MISATDIRRGQILKVDDDYHLVYSYIHIARGNKRGFVQVKMRNLRSGSMVERKFASDDKIELARVEEREAQFLYRDENVLVFMDNQTYEQVSLDAEILGEKIKWLTENLVLKLNYLDNIPVSVTLPDVVNLKVIQTQPYIKGATITNQFKPAKLENGESVQVPQYVEEGDIISINTETGEFVGRAKE